MECKLSNNAGKRRFSVTLTGSYEKALDLLVEKGLYIDHQDAIRDALRQLFQYHGIESFSEKEAAAPPEQ